MLEEGFEDVYHLKGGILKYLETIPKDKSLWEGECFVFDQRVAVTHGLDEGQYDQCYACRHPLSPKELESDQYTKGISCPYCFNKLSDKKKAGVTERQKQIMLSKSKGESTSELIVPNPDFPFLGVHFTRMTNGEIECGPNAVFTFKREGYGKTDFNFRDTVEALGYLGTWKLFFNNMAFGINEYRRAFSKRLFLKTLQHLVPSLTMDDLRPGRSGVRAMLLNTAGDTRDDFRIEYTDRSIHVLNAPSPAATACLSIGKQIMEEAKSHFKL